MSKKWNQAGAPDYGWGVVNGGKPATAAPAPVAVDTTDCLDLNVETAEILEAGVEAVVDVVETVEQDAVSDEVSDETASAWTVGLFDDLSDLDIIDLANVITPEQFDLLYDELVHRSMRQLCQDYTEQGWAMRTRLNIKHRLGVVAHFADQYTNPHHVRLNLFGGDDENTNI